MRMRTCRELAPDEVEAVWRRFRPRLRALVRRRVLSDADADDILQEVLIRVHANLGCLLDGAKLPGWLMRIARNAVVDHYRARRPAVTPLIAAATGAREGAEGEESAATGHDGDGAETDQDAIGRLALSLREMIDALPEPYREALVLTDLEGRSQKELAERHGISLSGAKSRVQRARLKLRDLLLACCHFELDSRNRVVDYWEHCCCCCGDDGSSDSGSGRGSQT